MEVRMNEFAHALAEHTAPRALAWLARALGSSGASALDPAVPSTLWRRALGAPAAHFLARPGKELRTSVARTGWMLGGGAGELPDRIAATIELLHAGSLIIDDVEDDSDERRGAPALHKIVGAPLAINTGSWMYFWALAELAGLELPGAVELAVRALVQCHQGQALDLSVRVLDLDVATALGVVKTITRLKTGALLRLAGELGALAAGAPETTWAAIGRFAERVGRALQMLDDLGSLVSRREKGREDLRGARPTWVWVWLAEVEPFAWARTTTQVRDVMRGIGDVDALADELYAIVGTTGRARIRHTLDEAHRELLGTLGPSAALEAVAAELRRMEQSYG
jgi:geranylgeranyl pyrophosphate synthase